MGTTGSVNTSLEQLLTARLWIARLGEGGVNRWWRTDGILGPDGAYVGPSAAWAPQREAALAQRGNDRIEAGVGGGGGGGEIQQWEGAVRVGEIG